MTPQLQLLLGLLAYVAIGRVVLSLLPAGWPGRHDRRELGVTLATSFLLGQLAFIAQGALATRLGWTMGFWPHFLPWVAIGALRVALAPAGLRPRHEPRPARPDALARAGFLVGGLLWIGLVVRLASESNLASAVHTTAAPLCGAVLAVAGLERARRSPRARAVAWLAWAGLALASADMLLATWGWLAAYLALGVTGTIAWLRRADRRGLALAALGFAAVGIATFTSAFGAAGLVALVVCTPAASRQRALGLALTAGGAALVLVYACLPRWWSSISTLQADDAPYSWVWLVPLVALPMTVVWVRLAHPAPAKSAVEPPSRELFAYGVTLSLAAAAAGVGEAAGGWQARETLSMLLPAAVVFLLLAFAPAERVA